MISPYVAPGINKKGDFTVQDLANEYAECLGVDIASYLPRGNRRVGGRQIAWKYHAVIIMLRRYHKYSYAEIARVFNQNHDMALRAVNPLTQFTGQKKVVINECLQKLRQVSLIYRQN